MLIVNSSICRSVWYYSSLSISSSVIPLSSILIYLSIRLSINIHPIPTYTNTSVHTFHNNKPSIHTISIHSSLSYIHPSTPIRLSKIYPIFIHLSIHLYIFQYSPIHISNYPPTHINIHTVSTNLFTYPSSYAFQRPLTVDTNYLSTYLSIHLLDLSISASTSNHSPIYTYQYPPSHLSIHPSMYLSTQSKPIRLSIHLFNP